jgi:hypothetical protein
MHENFSVNNLKEAVTVSARDKETSLPDTGDPILDFKEDCWDFGKIKEGAIVKHYFEFRNRGSSGLLITDVRTSCGCTAANVSDREILPGKKGKIKVIFNSKGFYEKVNVFINVESNDPARSLKQLSITAEVAGPPMPKIALDSYKQDLGVILENETMHGKIKILNSGKTGLIVECLHKDAVFFKTGKEAIFPLAVPAGKEIILDVNIPTTSKSGFTREYVLVISNDPKQPKLSVNICGYVISRERLKDLFTKYEDFR